jgi:hypothetical protein
MSRPMGLDLDLFRIVSKFTKSGGRHSICLRPKAQSAAHGVASRMSDENCVVAAVV